MIVLAGYPDCPVWIIGSTADGSSGYTQTIGASLKNAGKKVKVDMRNADHVTMQKTVFRSTTTLIDWMLERSRETNSSYNF